jgi:protein-S-isoprenylcysteine O-methyltransferase Ste14
MFKRRLFFAYGVASHVLFFGVYAWMAAFVGGFSLGFIPTIDGVRHGSLPMALAIDAGLIAIFGLQHSIMARPTFKQWWTRIIPHQIERSTYVLISCLLMILLMWQWRPLGGVVYDVTHPAARAALHALFAVGWLMVPAISFMISHFDLFGTRQVWLELKNRPYTTLPFRTPMAYRFVRHPLYVGWLIAFWATPTMTVAHLLFAGLMTAYILLAIPFEERNLVSVFGPDYLEYQANVGGLLPRWKRPASARLVRIEAVSLDEKAQLNA